MPSHPEPGTIWDALIVAESRESWFAGAWHALVDSGRHEARLTGEVDLGTSVNPHMDLVEARALFRLHAASAMEAEEVARRVVKDGLSDTERVRLKVTVFTGDRDWDEAVDTIFGDLEEW